MYGGVRWKELWRKVGKMFGRDAWKKRMGGTCDTDVWTRCVVEMCKMRCVEKHEKKCIENSYEKRRVNKRNGEGDVIKDI